MQTPEERYREAIALLRALIAIPSFSGQEGQASDFLETRLKAWFPGSVQRKEQNLLVTLTGPQEGPTLLLCSHIDTVGVTEGWTRDPFGASVEGDLLYGLGANDAGASLVSLIAACRQALPLQRGKILLCLVAEEETGSRGFCAIEPDLPRYDGALFGEPTGLAIARSMRGAMGALMRSHGKSCHASMPWKGKNAIDSLASDLATLRALDLYDDSPWGGATIEPTVVQGGNSRNQIPALVETHLDIRTTPGKNNAWITHALEQSGLSVEITANRRHPKMTSLDSAIVHACRANLPERSECVFYGNCDMAFSTAPSVILGPGKLEMAHVADECASLASIGNAIDLYGNILASFFDDTRHHELAVP